MSQSTVVCTGCGKEIKGRRAPQFYVAVTVGPYCSEKCVAEASISRDKQMRAEFSTVDRRFMKEVLGGKYSKSSGIEADPLTGDRLHTAPTAGKTPPVFPAVAPSTEEKL